MTTARGQSAQSPRVGFIALNHLDEDAIENYIFHRLDAPQRLSAERHLLSCPACREQLRATQEFIADMKTAFIGLSAPATAVAFA